MPRQIKAGEVAAARRRLYFQLVGTDGVTPATGEAGGQPQVSLDGGAWAGAGSVGTLSHVGDGRYYADLDASLVGSAGAWIESRYRSGSTAECPGDSALVVAYDPAEGAQALLEAVYAALAGTLTVATPLQLPAVGGTWSVVQGDDYLAAESRQRTWAVPTALDLTGAAVALYVYPGERETSGAPTTYACAAAAVAGGYDVSAGLTAAQTGAWVVLDERTRYAGRRYEVVATLANGHVVTLVSGQLLVTE